MDMYEVRADQRNRLRTCVRLALLRRSSRHMLELVPEILHWKTHRIFSVTVNANLRGFGIVTGSGPDCLDAKLYARALPLAPFERQEEE